MINLCLFLTISLASEQHTIAIEAQLLSGNTIYEGDHNPGILVSELKRSILKHISSNVISERQYKFKFSIQRLPDDRWYSIDEYIALYPNDIDHYNLSSEMRAVERTRMHGKLTLMKAMLKANPMDWPQNEFKRLIDTFFQYDNDFTEIFDQEIAELIGKKIEFGFWNYFRHLSFQFEIEQVPESENSKNMMRIVSDETILNDDQPIHESITLSVIFEKKYAFKFLFWVDFPFYRWFSTDEYLESFSDGMHGYYARSAAQVESIVLKGESTLIEAMLQTKPDGFKYIHSQEMLKNTLGDVSFSVDLIPLFDQEIRELIGEKIYFNQSYFARSEGYIFQFEIIEVHQPYDQPQPCISATTSSSSINRSV